MSAIDELLDLLQDNKWHDFKEIGEKVALPSDKTEMVVNFLSEYGFVRLKSDAKQIKIQPLTLDFLTEIQFLAE